MSINNSKPNQVTASKKAKIFNIFLVIVVLLLVYQNYQLKQNRSGLKKPKILSTGERVPKIKLIDMYGNVNEIDFSDSISGESAFSLLYIFSVNCSACNDNFVNWFKIDSTMKGKKINSYYIALDGGDELISLFNSMKSPCKIFKPISINFEKDYKIKGIPITLIIDSNREVRFSHLGKLSDSQMIEILKLLELTH